MINLCHECSTGHFETIPFSFFSIENVFMNTDLVIFEDYENLYIHLFARQMTGSIFQILYSFVWTTNGGEHLPC